MLIPCGVPPFIFFSIIFAGLAFIAALATYSDLSYQGTGKVTPGFQPPRLLAIIKLQKSIVKIIYIYFYAMSISFIFLMLECQKTPESKSVWYFWVLDVAYVLFFCCEVLILIPIIMKKSHTLSVYVKKVKDERIRRQSETLNKISSNLTKLTG